MSFNFNELKPKIIVFGVGGAGSNAVSNMIKSNLEGVEFWVANTDAQALESSMSTNKIQLGATSTCGLGAGSNPEVGRIAAEESAEQIMQALEGCNMAFITAGMGGGTGTGAAPVITRIAKEMGILTVGVVTKPFHFEGVKRMKIAEFGLDEMSQSVDTLIVIPNQNLFHIANEKTTFAEAFKMADAVLDSGIRSITDLITRPGVINLDFADIRAVMDEMGKAMMGTGEAEGENRARAAAEAAISNPLLDNSSMKGARGVLINITGSMDMTLYEVDEAANRVKEEVDPNANIIFGTAFNPDLEGRIRVSVVATGIDVQAPRVQQQTTQPQQIQTQPAAQQPQQPAITPIPQWHNNNYVRPTTVQQQQQPPTQQQFKPQEQQQQTNVQQEEPKRKERPLINRDNINEITKQGGFIPTQQREVDQYDLGETNAEEQPNKGLFSRMTANFSKIITSEETTPSRENNYAIPAILRKNKNEE